jgi:hypothetical protein
VEGVLIVAIFADMVAEPADAAAALGSESSDGGANDDY